MATPSNLWMAWGSLMGARADGCASASAPEMGLVPGGRAKAVLKDTGLRAERASWPWCVSTARSAFSRPPLPDSRPADQLDQAGSKAMRSSLPSKFG